MAQSTSRGTGCFLTPDDGGWTEYPPGTVYSCEVYLSQEGDAFLAETALSGISVRGQTEADALDKAQAAATEAVQAIKVAGRKIQWQRRDLRVGEVARVVTVRL